MLTDTIWRALFCAAIAVLMCGILLIRTEPSPLWVLISYPLVGAALANIASRTSPSTEDIARVETSVIAAAAIFVLACLVNVLLIDMLVSEIHGGREIPPSALKQWSVVLLPLISVCLWWALKRRLTRFRTGQAVGRPRAVEPAMTRSTPTRPMFSARDDRPRRHSNRDAQLRRHSR